MDDGDATTPTGDDAFVSLFKKSHSDPAAALLSILNQYPIKQAQFSSTLEVRSRLQELQTGEILK